MRKLISFVGVVALLLVGAVAAFANPEWNVIAESDPLEIEAEVEGDPGVEPPDPDEVLDVRVSITGETSVLVGDSNRYFLTVVNDNESTETLEEWALGLSVGDDVESLDDLSISTPTSDVDLTEGGTDVEATLEDGVVWLRGGVNQEVDPGQYLIRALDITFHESNVYVATAYVVDIAEDVDVDATDNGELTNGEEPEEGDETDAETSILSEVG